MSTSRRWCLILGLVAVALVGGGASLPGQLTVAQQTQVDRDKLVQAALAQVGVTVLYDPAYVKLAYPDGDVPADRGVCTDVVIRALRGVGVDLQVLVHNDKTESPAAYPQNWGHVPPDSNIDHRRVPNLMTYFQRQHRAEKITTVGTDYLPGDVVVWRLPSGLLHVGLVTERCVEGTDRPMVVHNIGDGAQCEDVLFTYTLIGHYRWFKKPPIAPIYLGTVTIFFLPSS